MGQLALLQTYCLLVFFASLLAGCSRPSGAGGPNSGKSLTKVTLQADWYPQPEHGGFYTALAKGYYKEEGLDVTIRPGGRYIVVEQQVSVGAAQFGMGSSDRTLESVADGQPLVAVAATMQRDPQGIMVRKDSPIRSFADLNGHTISIKPGYTWFAYLVKRYQLNDIYEIPATMSVANFVADPQYIQQAFATSEPFFARQAGIETRVLLISDTGYDPYRVMFTTQDFLQQHPETVAAFVRASLKGWRDYLADPTVAHAVIARLNPALNQEWMRFSWQALRDGRFINGDDPSGEHLGQMSSERWTTMYKQLFDLKVVDRAFDPATAYTLRFAEKKLATALHASPSRKSRKPQSFCCQAGHQNRFNWTACMACWISRFPDFDSLDKTYGPLGAAIGLYLLFYLSGFAILVGGEINFLLGELRNQRTPQSFAPERTQINHLNTPA